MNLTITMTIGSVTQTLVTSWTATADDLREWEEFRRDPRAIRQINAVLTETGAASCYLVHAESITDVRLTAVT